MQGRFLYILLVLSVALPVQAASPYGEFHALVIGNQNYKYLKSLKTPLADAEAVAEVLKNQYGFTVDLLKDADRYRTMRALSRLRRTMTDKKDNLLIYYAGHGYLDRAGGNAGYWQPIDAEKESSANWIATTEITPILKAIQARHVMIVADSCYSGELVTRDSGAQLATGMNKDEWLQRMLERRSRTALTSGGLEEKVWDSGQGNRHSIFAEAFLEALRDNQGVLTGDTLFDRIKHPVIVNSPQTPQYGDVRMTGHEMGDFILVPKALQGIGYEKEGEVRVAAHVISAGSTQEEGVPRFARGETSNQEREPQQGDTVTDSSPRITKYIPVGSDHWCQNMRDKPKEDWAASEAVDFAKHCIITAQERESQQTDTMTDSSPRITKYIQVGSDHWCQNMRDKPKVDWIPGELLDFAKYCLVNPERDSVRFYQENGQHIDHGDGTVTDTKTGLMWKRCSEGLSGMNCEDGKAKEYTWDDAAERFKNVEYAGYSDWRLPTIDELKTLVYCSKGKDKDGRRCNEGSERPAINQQAFPNAEENWYWSGSPSADSLAYAWYVNFGLGYSGAVSRSNYRAVRLVRDGQ